jgi:hypothetical protein
MRGRSPLNLTRSKATFVNPFSEPLPSFSSVIQTLGKEKVCQQTCCIYFVALHREKDTFVTRKGARQTIINL